MKKSASQKQKGMVLVYTLIVLTVLLVLGSSVMLVTQSQTRSAIATDKSLVAFFVAESGAEEMLAKIYAGAADALPLEDLNTDGNCSGGEFSETLSSGTWTAVLYESDGDQLTDCNDAGWRADVDEMKVTGTYSGTVRAVRMGIDPSP
jgi:Tfp pilus assembly protein PilX